MEYLPLAPRYQLIRDDTFEMWKEMSVLIYSFEVQSCYFLVL